MVPRWAAFLSQITSYSQLDLPAYWGLTCFLVQGRERRTKQGREEEIIAPSHNICLITHFVIIYVPLLRGNHVCTKCINTGC